MIIDFFQEYQSWPVRIQIYFGVAGLLMLCGLLFACIISISQLYKKANRESSARYRERVLTELGFLISQADPDQSDRDYYSSLSTLRMLLSERTIVSDILVGEILSLKKNMLGDGADYLVRIYVDLRLKEKSIKKLSSRSWKIIAQGLRELETMEQSDTQYLFIEFLHHRNQQLRKEARKGLVTLADKPLFFLDNLSDQLTEWEIVFIFKKLKARGSTYIPDFSRWYSSPNRSVASFAVRMTSYFGQVQQVDKLRSLLLKADIGLKIQIIECLSKSEAFTAVPEVMQILGSARFRRLILAALKFLANLGDERCVRRVERFLRHPSEDVRFETVRTLLSLQSAYSFDSDEARSMSLHIQTPLLA